MRTIIAGSRTITDMNELYEALDNCGWIPTVVISGTAKGVDRLGEIYSENNYLPLETYPADWNFYGKKAGYIRNKLMAENADAAIILWDGQSKGTKHMIDIAKEKGLKLYIHLVNDNNKAST